MHSVKKFEVIKSIRLATVIGIGALGTLATSFLIANGLRNSVNAHATLSDLTATLLGGTLCGLVVTALFCLLVFHAFSFFESTTLPQAIRLNEAMRMLHATTNRESMDALKYYRISVFRAKEELGADVAENVHCKLISTFLSPWFFRSDRNAAFGSANHCCDYSHIQEIVRANKAKWGEVTEQSDDSAADVAGLERKIADLREKKNEAMKNYTAASGRESQLKKQVAEIESHMAVLVELANKVTDEVKPPRRIKKDEIKAKYLAIGKIHGITRVRSAYMEIFRKNMPAELINWGGAPKQGSDDPDDE